MHVPPPYMHVQWQLLLVLSMLQRLLSFSQATWSWPARLTFLTFVKSRLVGPTWQAAKKVKHMAHTSHEERCL